MKFLSISGGMGMEFAFISNKSAFPFSFFCLSIWPPIKSSIKSLGVCAMALFMWTSASSVLSTL